MKEEQKTRVINLDDVNNLANYSQCRETHLRYKRKTNEVDKNNIRRMIVILASFFILAEVEHNQEV